MNIQKEALFLCLLMHCVHVCLSQNDCTGVDCPVLPNCIETVLEKGACCATCTQRGCTCEGYQYYDCIQAGFRKGKVPEGESYFVDFGSTECSCPRGGGKISCHFIPCPEIPPNCIEVVYPEDGCMRCGRIGCMHGSKKYEAGHSLQTDQCQVCHCPNEGGQLMCSAVPDCDPRKPVWETVIENNSPLRDISSRTQGQTSPMEPFSKQAEGNTLPLYKQEPPSFGKEDYDYTLAEPTSPAIQDLARPLESTTVPPAYQESNSTSSSSHDDKRHELGEKQLGLNSVRAGGDEVTRHVDSTAIEAQTKESTPLTTATHTVTTQNHWPQEETVERNSRHDTDGNALEETGHTAHDNKPDRHSGHHKRSDSHAANPGGSLSVGHYGQDKVPLEHRQMMTNKEQGTYPTVQFSPTNRAPVRVREDGEQPERQPQHTFYNYQPHNTEENTQVSAKELLKSCCETGEKWASANGHCNNMDPPSKDRHSICWTAQQQCCLGTLRESWCWAGIDAARAGSVCGADAGDKCGIDSYKECCGCCSLGLQFRREGHHCEAHQYLDHHCRHVFLNCCRGEDGMAESRDGWHTLRDTPTQDHSPLPNRVSDSPYPKEAFFIGEERDGANTVEGPVPELEDTETVDEENRLKEDDRAAAAPPSLLPPRFQPTVPVNPCEGNSPCEQQCTPVGRRPQCSCSLGFSLRTDGHSCEDINECLSAQACQVDERCVNTVGSFICQRLITCPPGYNIINDICEDIDECAQSIHNCGFDSDCVNTEGSFRCNPKPRCPVGFHHNTQDNCIDIDECASLAQPCSPGFNCINTAGSYMCQRKIICSRGYHASPDGSRCVDVDECQSSLHRCGEGQLCHNLPGSYRCECQTGYQYDSFRRMCVDINECWHYPSRLCAQTCENIPGSYKCSCTSGFRLSSDGKTCEDVNECLANPCSQECANIYGSYQCYCRKGYFLKVDGHTCEDIDECSQSIGHLCTYKCLNVPGSYQCACPDYGYTMSPNGRSCRDIDECTTGSHNCSLAETCYNIQGGYRCLSLSCPPNYRKVSDTRCERISCPNYLECQNSPLRITYYYLSFQSNIIIPAQIFRIGPSPAYSGDNVIVSITQGNEENYFSTRKLNAYTGAVYLHRQAESPRDFLLNVEMKLWRQGTFTTFQARIYVFITANSL